jgi:hypothetical protein
MADLDARASDRRQIHIVQLVIKARQFVFDGVQRFQHLAGQEKLGPQLCLAYGQHVANPLNRHSPDIFGRRRLPASGCRACGFASRG